MSLRVPSSPSASSTNTTQGDIFCASVNTASTSFCVSPNHLHWMLALFTVRNDARVPRATAFASSVFPVPGGP
jgi:hypothetical protein